jgi:hypothetical protein
MDARKCPFKSRIFAALIVGGALAFPSYLFSWESAFFDLFEFSYSARAAAMGGLHCALADDASTLFSNPAGFRSVKPQFTVSQATISLYESAPEILGEVFTGTGGSTALRKATVDVLGPLALSYVGKGWGFGLFDRVDVRFESQASSASELIEENLVFIGGRSFRIPLPERWSSTLDLGMSLVIFGGGRTYSYTDIREVLTGSVSPLAMLEDAAYFYRAIGAGIELGVRYSYKDWFAVGIAGRNLSFEQYRRYGSFLEYLQGGSSAPTYNVLPMDISAGILFHPPLGRLGWVLTDLLIAADYHNIFDFLIYPEGATNPLLHIGAGMELKFLKIVSLRAGYYQCLPSFGAGLDLSLFKLNFAYFGRELSSEPGGYPVYCYTFGVEFTY